MGLDTVELVMAVEERFSITIPNRAAAQLVTVGQNLPRDPAGHAVTLYLKNGPKWPPGATVDIVVRVVDTAGVAHLLSSRGQKIQAAM